MMVITHMPKGMLVIPKWADDGFGNLIWVSPFNEEYAMGFLFGE